MINQKLLVLAVKKSHLAFFSRLFRRTEEFKHNGFPFRSSAHQNISGFSWVILPHWNIQRSQYVDSRITRLNPSVAPVKLKFLLVKPRPRCTTLDVVRSPHNLLSCKLGVLQSLWCDRRRGVGGSRKGWHDLSGPHCVCAWKNKDVKERHCERADGLGCVGSEDYFSKAKTCIRLLSLWFSRAYMVTYSEKPGCMYILITISYLCASSRQIDA